LADLEATMRALRSRTRREILRLIWDREMAAGDIAAAFSLTAATISEHLAVLRQAGLVEVSRIGTSRRYRARPQALAGLHGALEAPSKWEPVEDVPERALATTSMGGVVTAAVTVSTSVERTFDALTDAQIYSRWLRAPVSLEDGEFAATLEWGIEVRGRYDIVVRPELIVMSWDFEDDNVPVPGHPLTCYLRVRPDVEGSRVQIHQLVDTPRQATFLQGAWAMVLGRLKANVVEATGGAAPAVGSTESTRSSAPPPRRSSSRPRVR
jgi:DNA-binding transcriptional ArsR family regulator/uncharacterized protein YndB with AHSA1/START domain